MSFDGLGTYATTSLPKSDCLQDPGRCVNGFSMGAKLKFDEEDMSYSTPKYIIDSGARSLTTRGVSAYIVNGNLFFELATAKKAWKVRKMLKDEMRPRSFFYIVYLFIDFSSFIYVIKLASFHFVDNVLFL